MKAVQVLLASLAAFLGQVAMAGGMGSGGGNGVVCKNDRGKITSAVLLDLFEGRSLFSDVHMAPANQPINVYLELAKARLAKTGYGLLIPNHPTLVDAIHHVQTTMRFLSDDSQFEVINDSFHFVIPVGCEVQQTAIFVDRENIVVNKKIWDALSNLDRSGLILHEAIYWLDRLLTDRQDSRRSRRVVSLSLGEKWRFDDVRDGMPASYIRCNSLETTDFQPRRTTVFAAYRSGEFHILQFLALNGDRLLSKTTSVMRAEFPLLEPGRDMAEYGHPFRTQSRYENAHEGYLNRHPVVDKTGQFEHSTLEITVKKPSYPSWGLTGTTVFCHPEGNPRDGWVK